MKLTIIGKEQDRLFSLKEMLAVLCLLLSFMDFKLYSMHLMVVAFGVFCLVRARLPVSRGAIPAILLSIALLLFWDGAIFSPTVWMKRLVWPAAFLLGYGLMWPEHPEKKPADISQKRANALLFMAAIGFLIHLLLNIYINWGVEDTGRNTVDFWTNKSRAATGQAGLACVPLAYFLVYLIRDKKFLKKLLAVLALVAMLYYNLTLGSRTMVVTLLILLASLLAYTFINRKQFMGKRGGWLALAGILLVALLAYSFNLWGIRDLIEESNLFNRMFEDAEEGLKTSRWAYKWEYIKNMPNHLFGGKHIYKAVGAHAHDVLLDTYDEAGILAFVAVIALLADGVAKLIRLFHSKAIQNELKVLFLGVYISIFITFAIEPILAGMPWLLMSYCFFHGIVTGLVKKSQMAATSVGTQR